MPQLKPILLYLGITCLFALTGYFSWKLQSENKTPPFDHSNIPDLVIQSFDLTQYDTLGNRRYFLTGNQLTYFKSPQDTLIQMPKLKHYLIDPSYNLEQNDWHAYSDRATLNHDKTKLTLIDHVNFFKNNRQTGNPLQIETSLLYVINQGERIETDQAITIQDPPSYLTGIGMIGYPKKDEFTLLHEVKTYYAPNQTKR